MGAAISFYCSSPSAPFAHGDRGRDDLKYVPPEQKIACATCGSGSIVTAALFLIGKCWLPRFSAASPSVAHAASQGRFWCCSSGSITRARYFCWAEFTHAYALARRGGEAGEDVDAHAAPPTS
jgi:hypothetical protein